MDIPADPVSKRKGAGQALKSTETAPARELCLETKTLPDQANPTDISTMRCDRGRANSAETAQDTKPAVRSQSTTTVDISEISRTETATPVLRQVTTGTQTENESSSLDLKTLNLKETLSEEVSFNTSIETESVGQTPPKDKRTRRKSRRRDDPEIPAKDAHIAPDLWTVLPFAQATWRSTHRMRAVTSAEEVDPHVLEVLDLPSLNLAAAQEEDPDLKFVKELLRDHDVRPPWDIVREESAEVKILWTQFHQLKIQEHVLYRRRKETTANPQWQVVAPKSLRSQRFSRLAATTPWLLIKE